jgi:hypothetical protein
MWDWPRGPGGEQQASLGCGDCLGRAILRQRQRRHGKDELARDVEAFPACRENAHPPAPFEQRDHQAGGRLQDVLAVVEHDQHLAVGEHPYKGRGRARGVSFRNLQRLGHACRDECGVGEGRQFGQPGAVAEPGLGEGRRTQGQAGLAAPAGPVSVTIRAVWRRSSTAAICGPRPTSELTSAGNPEGRWFRAVCTPSSQPCSGTHHIFA